MRLMASQINSLTIVYSTVYSGADQRKLQSSASLAFVRGIHRGPVNSPHKRPVTRKMFPFDDVIMYASQMTRDEENVFISWSHHGFVINTCNFATASELNTLNPQRGHRKTLDGSILITCWSVFDFSTAIFSRVSTGVISTRIGKGVNFL